MSAILTSNFWKFVDVSLQGGKPLLCLGRHVDEQIVIGNDIVITVVKINGDYVRLGIEAPRDVPIHRREVADRITAERGTDETL